MKSTYKALLFAIIVFFLLLFIKNEIKVELPCPKNPIRFYSNQCRKDLKDTFISGIQKAKQSIFLVIYTLTDKKILEILNKKSYENIKISIIIDHRCYSLVRSVLNDNIEVITKKESGLMHQKILIIDQSLIFIGSSNLTSESLRMHDNLVVSLISIKLAEKILNTTLNPVTDKNDILNIGTQEVEWWSLPNQKEALARIIELIKEAKNSLKIALFTWTHPLITQAVIDAKNRGVKVEVILDYQSGIGSSAQTLKKLKDNNVCIYTNKGAQLLHHKFAYIDQGILINGSTNWTISAFKKNRDCFLVIHNLNNKHKQFLDKLWYITLAQSQLERVK